MRYTFYGSSLHIGGCAGRLIASYARLEKKNGQLFEGGNPAFPLLRLVPTLRTCSDIFDITCIC